MSDYDTFTVTTNHLVGWDANSLEKFNINFLKAIFQDPAQLVHTIGSLDPEAMVCHTPDHSQIS